MGGGFSLCENYFASNLSDHIKTISLAAGGIIKDQFSSLRRFTFRNYFVCRIKTLQTKQGSKKFWDQQKN